jgi:hypothetical protein
MAARQISPRSAGPSRTIDAEYQDVSDGLAAVRNKLGEERYAGLMKTLAETKTLFLTDQEDANGKTHRACLMLWDMFDVIEDVRKERFAAGLPDVDGEVTGD